LTRQRKIRSVAAAARYPLSRLEFYPRRGGGRFVFIGFSPRNFVAAKGVLMSGTTSTITGSITTGVTLTSATYTNPVTVAAGASISTTAGYAVYSASEWTIQNAGVIDDSSASYGINLQAGGAITNAVSGTILGYFNFDNGGQILGNAIYIKTNADAGTVLNQGYIKAGRTGVFGADGGEVTNAAGGVIDAGQVGIQVLGGPGNVVNDGTITGFNAPGVQGQPPHLQVTDVDLVGGGTVTNAGYMYGFKGVQIYHGGVVNNEAGGTINAKLEGVYAYVGAATVVNQGTIESSRYGIELTAGGTVDNSGVIKATGGYDC
jgi:fibronectin-binding autotransporter adhesin